MGGSVVTTGNLPARSERTSAGPAAEPSADGMTMPRSAAAPRTPLAPIPDTLPVIAVVIPAYRAASHIRSVLEGIPSFVHHIVVVDDGSPDETGMIVKSWPDPRARLVVHARNQGVGGAVLSGYEEALTLGAEILVKMDGDDQMDPAYIWPLVAPILYGQADYAKGNRFLHARELHSMPLVRRIGNAGLSFLTKAASGYWNVFDPTNGYTAIHASVARNLNRANLDRRFFFESSMFLELSLMRAVVRDVSIPARYRNEKSSLSEGRALVQFPARLLRGLLRRWMIQYYLRDFTAFSVFLLTGLSMVLFGTAWGSYHWLQSYRHGGLASTGTVMIAVLPIIVGIQLLLEAVILDIQNVPTRPLQEEDRLHGSQPR
jgi:glycosyltransferase involved in cell wall biosynthesis